MALRAGDVIAAARFAHPAFDRALAPTSVCAQMVDEGQARLLLLAHQHNPSYGIAQWVIRLLPDQNIAQVGANLPFGSPLVQGTTVLARRDVNTGSLAIAADSAVRVQERAATSGGLTTLTDTRQVWSTDYWLGLRVRLMSGAGVGQWRTITTNTSTTLTVDPPFAVAPDSTTTYRIEEDVESVGGEFGVVLGNMPPLEVKSGFLVLLDAQGQPYLDLSAPVTVDLALGIPMPPHSFVDHGEVRFEDTPRVLNHVRPLTLVPYGQRHAPPRDYCATVSDQQLLLMGPMEQWKTVVSLSVPYLPLPPSVSAEGDLLLMREDAKSALVAQVVLGLCRRARIMGVSGPPNAIEAVEARANEMEQIWLGTIGGAGRAKVLTTKEVW